MRKQLKARSSAPQPPAFSSTQTLVETRPNVKELVRKRIHYFMAERGMGKIDVYRALEQPEIKKRVDEKFLAMNEGESVDSRARDDHYSQYFYDDIRELKKQLAVVVSEMLKDGKAAELVDSGTIYFGSHFFWHNKEVRVEAVRILLDVRGKSSREKACTLVAEDYCQTGLLGLITGYYNNSPHVVVKAIYPDVKEWEMAMCPMSFYENAENRGKALTWLLEKLGKTSRGAACEVSEHEYRANGLRGLLSFHGERRYLVLKERWPDLRPEEMKRHCDRHASA